jgi:hypothetical protein
LQFDKATFASAPTGIACGACNTTLLGKYWQAGGQPLCAHCRQAIEQSIAEAQTNASFVRALVRAGAVALACGVAYAMFVELTNIVFGLVTIGIGYLVGGAMQKVTRGFGTRRYQILAVVLTYLAVSMGNIAPIVKEFDRSSQHATGTSETSNATNSEQQPVANENSAEAAPTPAPETAGSSSFGSMIKAFALLFVLCLASPFFGLTTGMSGLLSLAIVFFGLQSAWRRSAGAGITVTGPFEVAKPELVNHGFE